MNLVDKLSGAGHTAVEVAKKAGYYGVAVPAVTFLLPDKHSMAALDGLAKRAGIEERYYRTASMGSGRTTISALAETIPTIALLSPTYLSLWTNGDFHLSRSVVTAWACAGALLVDGLYRIIASELTGKAIPTLPIYIANCMVEAAGKLGRIMRHRDVSGTAT